MGMGDVVYNAIAQEMEYGNYNFLSVEMQVDQKASFTEKKKDQIILATRRGKRVRDERLVSIFVWKSEG